MGMMTMMMQPPTNTRVFVSNLAYEVQWQDLKDLMKRVGTVVRADVFTDASGRSKGNGVVEFSHPAEAALAIQTLNNADLRGRPVLLREDRPPGGAPLHHGHVVHVAGAQASSAAGSGSVGTRVYIGNLAWDVAWQVSGDAASSCRVVPCSLFRRARIISLYLYVYMYLHVYFLEQDLKDHIRNSGFPSVMSVDVLMEGGGGGRSKGCAIAQFPDSATAAAAIQGLNNTSLHGRQMFVREDREEGK
jgi:RNA recognition motif-containing protein